MSDYTPKHDVTGNYDEDAVDAPKSDVDAPKSTDGEPKEARQNLREAGDALLAAGSALGAAIGKFAEDLPERFKTATDSARETMNAASTEGEVRSIATNFTNEAEKVFNSLRERDLQFTEDSKAKLRSTVADIRASFNDQLDKLDGNADGNVVNDLRARFDQMVERVQAQFSGEDTPNAEAEAQADIIDGEIVETDTEK